MPKQNRAGPGESARHLDETRTSADDVGEVATSSPGDTDEDEDVYEERDLLAGLPNPRVLGLAADVAANIRFEAARRGLSQGDLADIIGRSRAAVSSRWHCQVAWTIQEVGLLARAMAMRPGDFLAVPAPVQRYEW